MQPYDGIGYGISAYWDYQANAIAEVKKEACGHRVNVKFSNNPEKDYSMDVRISCSACKRLFPKSEKKVLKDYLKFYGMKV